MGTGFSPGAEPGQTRSSGRSCAVPPLQGPTAVDPLSEALETLCRHHSPRRRPRGEPLSEGSGAGAQAVLEITAPGEERRACLGKGLWPPAPCVSAEQSPGRPAAAFPVGEGGKTDVRSGRPEIGISAPRKMYEPAALPAAARFLLWPISAASVPEPYLAQGVGEHPSRPVALALSCRVIRPCSPGCRSDRA